MPRPLSFFLLFLLLSGTPTFATEECPLHVFDPGSTQEQKRMWAKGEALQKRRDILQEAERIDAMLSAGGPEELLLRLDEKLLEAERITTRHKLPDIDDTPEWFRLWSASVAAKQAQEVSDSLTRKMATVKKAMGSLENKVELLEQKEKSLRESLGKLTVFDGRSRRPDPRQNALLAVAQADLAQARDEWFKEVRHLSVLQAQREEVAQFIVLLKPNLESGSKNPSSGGPTIVLSAQERVLSQIEAAKEELAAQSRRPRTPDQAARLKELKDDLETLVLYLEALKTLPPEE